ncbi:MAG: hypothetical protein QNI91_18535 [Arenicellales bacterium]|nr:hypothetical protein [Arenicellales bacterium]
MFDAFTLSALFELDTLWTAVRIAVTVATIVTLNVFIGNQTIVKLDDQEDLVDFSDFESFNTSSI